MLCCVCLLQNSNTFDVFDNAFKAFKISDIINQHFWFKVTQNNEDPAQICFQCWGKVKDFHEFYEAVERSHTHFQQNVAVKKEEKSCTNVKLESESFEENLMQVEIEIDANINENQNTELFKENPLEAKSANSPSDDTEYQQELENGRNESSSSEYQLSDGSEESYSEDTKNRNKKQNISTCLIKKSKSAKANKKKEISYKNIKTGESGRAARKKWTDKFLDPILTEQMIKKHINMICDLCVFNGSSFPDMVNHFKKYHPKVRPYIMCCDRKFTKRYYVAQHALKHEDPNYFRCEECNKSFTTTCSLRTHNLSHHAPEEELLHSCDLCPRKFARRNLLELHRPVHIPKEDWTFVCTKCTAPKSFATSYLLNIHNGMNHKKAANICHVCAKEIKDKHAFEKHVRLHFEDSGPRVKCPYPDCDSWLKDEDNLKSHLQRHNPEGKIYKCPDCNKVCKNRGALTNHKRYSHSNEIFQCEQCDKTFKKAISLREHMTQHTGETLYKCPFCTRTFNSNANMHSHKKKKHPTEWDEWRRNKKGSAQSFIKNISSPLF